MNPDLVVRDKNGEIYTVRYDAVNAMLLTSFLKSTGRSRNWELRSRQSTCRAVTQQAAQIQKVSAQVNATKPLPHLVLNNP